MSEGDWAYVTRLARQLGVTLGMAGVKRSQTLGRAIDCVLDASGN